MRFSILIVLCLNIVVRAQSNPPNQNFLTGTVRDSNTFAPIEYASVVQLRFQDSSVVNGTITDSSGFFKLKVVVDDSVLLKFSYLGYNPKFINFRPDQNFELPLTMGNIALTMAGETKSLQEMQVVGQMDLLRAGIDKKIYNVEDDLSAKGGNASNILQNLPGVEVDMDGNITLRGDANVLILIDGRPSGMTGNASKILQSFPANSIERVEIVTNPSAKYDPDGTSGIINIVLKKNKLKGGNFQIGLTGATGNAYQTNVNAGWRNGKWNFFGSYGTGYTESDREFDRDTRTVFGTDTSRLLQTRPGMETQINHTARLGLDRFISEWWTAGLSSTFYTGKEINDNLLLSEYTNSATVDSNWLRSMYEPEFQRNIDFNAYAQKKFKKDDGALSMDFRYSEGTVQNEGRFEQYYFSDLDYQDTIEGYAQRLDLKSNNQVITTQVDANKVWKNWRFEGGAKQILRFETLNSFSERSEDFETFGADTLANFDYAYDESISSAYFIVGQAHKKWKYQVGVRPEYSIQTPQLLSQDSTVFRSFFNFFPSAHLRYGDERVQEWGLSYSRRINRASSRELNPFVNYSDPNNLRSGNPFLNPEFINSLELSYIKRKEKWDLSVNLFYRYTTDVIQRFKIFNGNTTTTITWENIDESESYGTEVNWTYKPTNQWKNVISVQSDQTSFRDRSGSTSISNSGFNFGVKYTGSYSFWKNTADIQFNGRYNSPRVTIQGTFLPRASMDVSVQKRWKEGTWSAILRLSDVLNTQEFRFSQEQGDNFQSGRFKRETRRLWLTVQYSIGKFSAQKKENTNRNGGGGFEF